MTHAPVTATNEIAERIREHCATRLPIRIVAAGTWQRAGAPVTATETQSLADDRGIVEYVPGDLTITLRAGTTLGEIAETTRAHSQFLTLDPWGGDTGTIGATIATATAGPRAAGFGLPRDAVLGMEFVSGSGSVIRAGGRVVKNVAGFDLVRLLTGSWGTLGAITELTLRLRAIPERQETLVLAIGEDTGALADCGRRLRALPFTVFAAQIVNAPLARRLGLPESTALIAQIGGNARAVAAQRDALKTIGRGLEPAGDHVWTALRACDDDAVASWRCSGMPSAYPEIWTRAQDAAQSLGAFVHGDPWRGVVRVVVPASADARAVTRAAIALDGANVPELLPAASGAWPGRRARKDSERVERLSRAIREKFDPAGILNRGILGAT
jgi:glycolate oxidase FAD binding subunit